MDAGHLRQPRTWQTRRAVVANNNIIANVVLTVVHCADVCTTTPLRTSDHPLMLSCSLRCTREATWHGRWKRLMQPKWKHLKRIRTAPIPFRLRRKATKACRATARSCSCAFHALTNAYKVEARTPADSPGIARGRDERSLTAT